jgi:hypothetical protein
MPEKQGFAAPWPLAAWKQTVPTAAIAFFS